MNLKPSTKGGQPDMFERMYLCFEACKRGFKEGYRPLIGIDGCHLNGLAGGQLLTAVGIDANNQIFPIAFAIVEIENADNWRCFLETLRQDVGIIDQQKWTLITDKQNV